MLDEENMSKEEEDEAMSEQSLLFIIMLMPDIS